jgi:hypothetical protein
LLSLPPNIIENNEETFYHRDAHVGDGSSGGTPADLYNLLTLGCL